MFRLKLFDIPFTRIKLYNLGRHSSSYPSGQKFMSNVNYPLVAPQRLKYRHIITAPSGYMIKIAIPSDQAGHECKNASHMEVSLMAIN